METIVAAATGVTSGGVSIVRLSGDKAVEIASGIIEKNKPLTFLSEPRKMQLVNLKMDTVTDKCLAVYFKAPFSFTGEDIVEFHIHGGAKLTLNVISKLISLGAREALPGEFSKRAFLNGKISLDEAEGIIDIINAESDSQIEAASKLSSGEFFGFVKASQQVILTALANLDVLIDYEYDDEIGESTLNGIYKNIEKLAGEIGETLNSYKQGKLIKSGLYVALVGSTNAGKSSLLNAMCKSDVAIVSNIAGTTRDVIKESIVYKGIKLNFLDTAGLRETSDQIEKLGINKTHKTASESDVILYLLDVSKPLDESEKQFVCGLDKNKTILVLNKIDKSKIADVSMFKGYKRIEVSAKESKNITELLNLIVGEFCVGEAKSGQMVLTNERHFNLVKKCLNHLTEAEKLIKAGETIELISFELQGAYNALGEITGEVGADQIIDKIFSDFCVGK